MAFRDTALEGLEDAIPLIGFDADALIADDQHRMVVASVDRDLDRFAEPELDRVREQVGDDLIDTRPVPLADDLRARCNGQR